MKPRFVLSSAIALASLVMVVPASATPHSPVRIQTLISFAELPASGTFLVAEGAEVLGCSAGSFVDLPAGSHLDTHGWVVKVLTCLEGGYGQFMLNFQPTHNQPGPGEVNGHWNITDSNGDFVSLYGQGDYQATFITPWDDPNPTAVETFSGVIHYQSRR